MTRIAIIGADGQLGTSLQRVAAERSIVVADLPEVDLTRPQTVEAFLQEHEPEVLIDCAAWTDVEAAEDHPEQCMAVNVAGTDELAQLCTRHRVKLVYISTDYVFDGDRNTPYQEDQPTGGKNVYARSKAGGERAALGGCHDALVVRSSWLFGPGGRNFVEAIIRQAGLRDTLTVVDDQTGCPTFTDDLARAIYRLVDLGTEGIVHFCNSSPCTWYDFAREIVQRAGLDVEIVPVTTDEMAGFKAARPTYSVLDTSLYTRLTDRTPRPWQDALVDYLADRTS